ncbi:hypothetical protein F5B22DRAFT_603351 [Xylaria bambusicola]|uniref:uncharacterized protein n=1 Tax=Xylaria bambusicola TaxID=326684 RepID=UPI002008423E|nr:uncharacterized protein F5B22DRAFT_603351 [Xylaria bambusicola]KAI0517549.1 hypothetical protein F5B22DRAFT_603351 [Xylaria bambusicola]
MAFPATNAAYDRCLFPTSNGNDSAGVWGKTPVFDQRWSALIEHNTDDFEPSYDRFQQAWAILLRNYLREHIVAFVCVAKNENSKDGASFSANVVRYELPATLPLEEISPNITWQVSIEALQGVQINTAIDSLGDQEEGFSVETAATNTEWFTSTNSLHLVLRCATGKDSDRCYLNFRQDFISRSYAEAIVGTFQLALRGLKDTQLMVYQLDLTSREDRVIMADFNHDELYEQKTCMHYLVEGTARVMPQGEAVCAWDGNLTYGELDSVASVVARRLVREGLRPGNLVPFAYEKTLWTVVATLAILKAGGAFVPIDGTQPKSRLREILKNTGAKLVLTSDIFAPVLQGMVEKVVVISESTVNLKKEAARGLSWSVTVRPEDPIFVLFTSGSTGAPKGMILEHGAICTHAITHGALMRYHGARVLQFAAHTFDVAIMDIFTTLIYGGCICIPSEEDRRANVLTVIQEMKVNHAILTPVMANLIDPADVPTLEILSVGGEKLREDCVNRWADKVSFIQIYGPAEVGICMAIHMTAGKTRPETVGYPLLNSSCWLVDPDDPNKLVSVGAVGELVVAGPSLARGYLNNEAKTASSFLTNLAWAKGSSLENERFFKTGDLLRYNTSLLDGSFDFIGRKDAQIKLRGQRIEPGEVEHYIGRMPDVTSCMVTRPDGGELEGQLVAVVQLGDRKPSKISTKAITVDKQRQLQLEELQLYLSKFLPNYMIPTACITLEMIPLVPSLKIDRNQVKKWLMDASPADIGTKREDYYLQYPLLEQSETIALQVSCKIADLSAKRAANSHMGIRGRDFRIQDMGIDSVDIMSLSIFIQKAFLVKVPLARLLDPQTTIRGLASTIQALTEVPENAELPETAAPDYDEEAERLARLLQEKLDKHAQNGEKIATSARNGCPVEEPAIVPNILLTGATGYLGISILRELITTSDANIFALVRCKSEEQGVCRLISAAIKSGWWQDQYQPRIRVLPGDLSQENLGLSKENSELLSGNSKLHIDTIIHNGAVVHYSSSYKKLKAANVDSTFHLLELAAVSDAVKNFIFVSGGRKPVESFEPDTQATTTITASATGYAQSKYVAESLILKIKEHPLFADKSVKVIKPGYIVAPIDIGWPNESDLIWRLIAGCIETGAYNADEADHWLFISDASHVARAVTHGIHELRGKKHAIYPVTDGLRFSDVWELLKSSFGYRLEQANGDSWLAKLREAIVEKQEHHLLFPLLDVLESDGRAIGTLGRPFGDEKEEEEVRQRIKEVMTKNILQLIKSGFLPTV